MRAREGKREESVFSFAKRESGADAPNKELQKLKRQDLLELLLEQMRESDQLEATIEGLNAQITALTDLTDYLKQNLSEKDALVDQLQRRLDLKDKIIAQLLAQGRKLPAELAEMEELLAVEQSAIETYISENYAAAQTTAPRHSTPPSTGGDA